MAQPPLDTAVEKLLPLFACQKYDYVHVLCFWSLTISGHESACPVRSSANTELGSLLCFRSDGASLFCPDRVFSLPTNIILPQPHQEVFLISQIVIEGDFWGFSLLVINIILLSFASLVSPCGLMGPELPVQGASASQVGSCGGICSLWCLHLQTQ